MNSSIPRSPGRRGAIQRLAALAAGAALAGPARAHTDSPHASGSSARRKEQTDWGIAGDARNARRRIEVRMADDMRFTPDHIAVRQGETVRFVVRNAGKLMHEFVIGTRAESGRHAEMMVKFPNMEHDEPYMAHVPPGKSAEVIWNFNRAGEFEFACLIAGHYQGGMVGTIVVTAVGKT